MTVVHIYKLDCDDYAVSKLPEGEHVIGRGPLLQCDDRRVSRNHGVIKITQDVATITSTHVNPCFYQPAASKTITILTKDTPMNLGNGDKFALLADKFWYKIKLEEANANGSVTDLASSLHVPKRAIEDESPTCSKRIKTEPNNKAANVNLNETFEDQAGDLQNILENLRDNLGSSFNVENKDQDDYKDKNRRTRGKEVMSSSDSDNDAPSKPLQRRNKKPRQKTKAVEQTGNLTAAALRDHDARVMNMLFSSDEDVGPMLITPTVNQAPANTNNAENKNTDDIKDRRCTTTSVQNTNQEIKIEANDEDLNCTNFDTNQQKIKTENDQTPECSQSDDTNKPGPSDTTKKKPNRDRCWYGMQCYRKNVDHLAEYSHPGDSDFESDPDDNRPTCSFGAACYRRNKDHREEYKHPRVIQKPPGKRPKNNTTPKRKRAPKQQYKDTPEDDYDLDDPFIDDSGSEYAAESDSEDSDSDSSGSEEQTKRLLKEAKRFTKGKKKDQDDD